MNKLFLVGLLMLAACGHYTPRVHLDSGTHGHQEPVKFGHGEGPDGPEEDAGGFL